MKFINLKNVNVLISIDEILSFNLNPFEMKIVEIDFDKFIKIEIYNDKNEKIFSSIVPSINAKDKLEIRKNKLIFNDVIKMDYIEKSKIDFFFNYILVLTFLYVLYIFFF